MAKVGEMAMGALKTKERKKMTKALKTLKMMMTGQQKRGEKKMEIEKKKKKKGTDREKGYDMVW